jgi:mRNA-degrading endonuclease YafQ of YafQ-DinJ toxin-antitoxin module
MPTQPTTNNLEGWEEEFNKYKLEENGKWKIERVFAKKFISELKKRDMEELIKIVSKLKTEFETRVAWKNLKPESRGYNQCALKTQIKVKQVKQLIKDYYET